MELALVVLLVAAVAALWYFNRSTGFDANKDGKVNVRDVKPLVQNTLAEVKQVADVNKDGKVNVADAKAVVEKVAKKAAKPKTSKPKAPAKPKAPKKPKMTVA